MDFEKKDLGEGEMDDKELDMMAESLMMGDEIDTITMTSDDGQSVEYLIIDEFDYNEKNYLVLVKSDESEDEEAEATIFKLVMEEGEDNVYEEITPEEYKEIEEFVVARMSELDIDVQ